MTEIITWIIETTSTWKQEQWQLLLLGVFFIIAGLSGPRREARPLYEYTAIIAGRTPDQPPFDCEFVDKATRDAWWGRNGKKWPWFDPSKPHTRKNPQ